MTVPLSLSSVPAVLPYIQYVATGGQTVYPYPFPITQDADLVVVINGVTQPTDSGYTLSGQGNATGGNVTLNVGSTGGDIITLFRNVTIQRLTQIGQNSGFSSAAFNAEFNNIYLILQQLQESISLSLQIPNTNSPAPVPTLASASYASKYLGFDSFGNPTPVSLTSSGSLTGQIVASLLSLVTGNPPTADKVRTAAEIAAVVTPTNYAFPPGNVRRYGAVGDSVTNDAPAFQAAINVARNGGGAVRVPASSSGGAYLLTSMLDCTYAGNANTPTFGFIGEPSSPAGAFPAILAKHTATAIFDCTGSYGVLWQDFQVRCDAAIFPKVGWLLARNSLGGSQLHKFRGISVQGYFSDTCVYNFGSEQEVYEGCFFYNNATGNATNVLTWTANNYKAYTSPFVTIKAGAASTTIHQIFGGSFGNTGANAGNNVFYLEGTCDGVKAYGAWTVCISGQATVYADMSGGAGSAPNFCVFDGISVETGGVAYGVLFSNHVNTPTGWSLTNWKSTAATYFLSAGASAILDNFQIKHLSETATKGINVPGTLQNSSVDVLTILVAGTALRCLLVGTNANFTITTNNNSVIIDRNTGAILTRGGIGMWGNTAAAQLTGWGTPTAGAVINNFPGSAATLSQCGQAITEVILQLKAMGLFGA